MTKTLITCDRKIFGTTTTAPCGKPALSIQYFIDRTMDGAGSMENNYGYLDLCHEHAIESLTTLVGSRTKYTDATDVIIRGGSSRNGS